MGTARTARALAGLTGLVTAGIVFATLGPALAANWINPHTGMSFAPMIVITPGAPTPVNLCAVNPCTSGTGLTTTGTAVVTPTTTTNSTTIFGANGASTTTVNGTTATAFSALSFLPSYKAQGNAAVSPTSPLTLASLTSPQAVQTVCIGSGCPNPATLIYDPYALYTFTATPQPTGQITVTATLVQRLCPDGCSRPTTTSSTVTLNVPPPPAGTSTNSSKPAVFPDPTTTAPVKGPEPVVEGVAAPTAPEAKDAIDKCGIQVPNCVADALDAYANHLEQIAASLPPSMRRLPQVFHEAARKVRAAKSPAEAVRAITTALAQVKASITLIRAVDPDTRAFGKQVGAESVDVLMTAKVALSRVSGL